MKACQAIIKCLQAEGVDVIFGYPGAAVAPIYEELRKSDITHILTRHEQGAGHSANGYARATGKVGVCLVTSGPGATNVITAVATAYMDSIPMVIITGQVNTHQIGKDVFQEADITGSTEPFTKHNYLVKSAKDLPRIMKEAFYIARTGRPGPVLVDIPMDIQNRDIHFSYPEEVDIRGYKPKTSGHKLQIKKAIQMLEKAEKPLLVVGGGVACADARKELREFIKLTKLPVVHTMMGKDAVEGGKDHDYNLGIIGMHGHPTANKVLVKADTLICIGTRFGDRAVTPFSNSNNADIIHIDIDAAEIGKNLNAAVPVVGDAKEILTDLMEIMPELSFQAWNEEIAEIKAKDAQRTVKVPVVEGTLNPREAVKIMSNLTDDKTILVSDVGQNLMWAARHFDTYKERMFFCSGGLGTMGYALPTSIGVKVASPEKTVIATVGDGGFQMSVQELGTIINYDVNVIIILFNNSGLGMVREIQNVWYKNTYAVDICKNPDFVMLAKAYGLNSERVSTLESFEEAFKNALKQDKATIIECMVSPEIATLL